MKRSILTSLLLTSVGLWACESTSQAQSYRYDELGRLERVEYPDGTVVVYNYDPAGNRTQRSVQAGNTQPTNIITAEPDALPVRIGTPRYGSILHNDTDTLGRVLTLQNLSQPHPGGAVTIYPDQKLISFDGATQEGQHTSLYTVTDGLGNTAQGTVFYEVEYPFNHEPHSWALSGWYTGIAPPPNGRTAFGSWVGDDANMGALFINAVSTGPIGQFDLQVMSGPDGSAGRIDILWGNALAYEDYVDRYPDLHAGWSTSGEDKTLWGRRHWRNHGIREGRDIRILLPGLDFAAYVDRYPDLLAGWSASGQDKSDYGRVHWYSHGQSEGRTLPRIVGWEARVRSDPLPTSVHTWTNLTLTGLYPHTLYRLVVIDGGNGFGQWTAVTDVVGQ